MRKIKYGKAEVVKEGGNIRILKFRHRYYTAVGRMFAVAGNHWDKVGTPEFKKICEGTRYAFCDWGNLQDMYIDD